MSRFKNYSWTLSGFILPVIMHQKEQLHVIGTVRPVVESAALEALITKTGRVIRFEFQNFSVSLTSKSLCVSWNRNNKGAVHDISLLSRLGGLGAC